MSSYRIPEKEFIDLPPIETNFVKNERGEKLHAELLEDMRSKNYDPFAERNDPSADKAYANAQKLVYADSIVRSTLRGPSVQREKFSSTYWRTWNKEKNLLEDISYDEVIKHNLSSYLNNTTRKMATVQQRSGDHAKHTLTTFKSRQKKATTNSVGRRVRAVAFDAPGAYEAYSMYTDAGNKGDNSVAFLMKACLKQKLPVNPREKNATIDPDDIGARPTKGGGLPLADRLSRTTVNTTTSKCDYPPLLELVDPHKGQSFGTNPRFKEAVSLPVAEKSDAVSLSTIERPTPKPRIIFNKAERFSDKDTKASIKLKIPVRTEPSIISAITVDPTALPGSANLTEVSQDETAEVDHAALREMIQAQLQPADSQPHLQLTGTAGVAEGSVSAPSAEQQQYIEYEYFPGDRPGPGHYEIPRLFDDDKSNVTAQFDALIAKYRAVKPGLAGLSCENLTNVAVFGQMCNRHEHVLYGMCLDGKCCRRSEVEKFMLRRNDLRRLAGYPAVERHGRNKDGLRDEITYCHAILDALPPAEYPVQPLYAAAYNGDVNAIRSLAELNVDPNVQHPDSGYTALHAAVFKCKLDAVAALLSFFRGRLRLDLQDKKGDTALHVASKMGFVEIAGMICDEDSCDPLCCKNKDGKYPADVVRSHKVFQMIKICQTRNELRKELKDLKHH